MRLKLQSHLCCYKKTVYMYTNWDEEHYMYCNIQICAKRYTKRKLSNA